MEDGMGNKTDAFKNMTYEEKAKLLGTFSDDKKTLKGISAISLITEKPEDLIEERK
jgi:hypothetical protein